MDPTRRCFSLVALGLFCSATCAWAETPKVLMLTKSQGFQHSVVARKGDALGLAERIVVDLGKKYGFEVDATKDGGKITAENLKNYDALFFFTQGEITELGLDRQPPVPMAQRGAILDFVKNGGGFVGTHCGGADTFHRWIEGGKKPFLAMVGGEFIGHGAQQVSRVEVVDPSFPGMSAWPKSFSLNDEWYAYTFYDPNMHVLMMLQTSGMKGGLYERENYPITWCSRYGKGRVFYTGMGHREDVWENPRYQEMVAQGVLWALGKKEGDATPNLESLFGDAAKGFERINPPKR